MIYIVFLLEEESAKVLLEHVLDGYFPDNVHPIYIPHEGKQALEKSIPIKLRSWNLPDSWFVVMRDKDSANLEELQESLEQMCRDNGRPESLVRIVVHELESWVLGDLEAVGNAFNLPRLAEQQGSAKFRNPDVLANANQELKRLVNGYQKVSGARKVAPFIDIQRNKSASFQEFISGLNELLVKAAH